MGVVSVNAKAMKAMKYMGVVSVNAKAMKAMKYMGVVSVNAKAMKAMKAMKVVSVNAKAMKAMKAMNELARSDWCMGLAPGCGRVHIVVERRPEDAAESLSLRTDSCVLNQQCMPIQKK